MAIRSLYFLLLKGGIIALGQLLTVLLLSTVQGFPDFFLKRKITKVLVIAQIRNQDRNIWIHLIHYTTFIRMSEDEEAKLMN